MLWKSTPSTLLSSSSQPLLFVWVGALPRLCDVLRVLREEREQCQQELSKDRTGDLGVEQPTPATATLPSASTRPASLLAQPDMTQVRKTARRPGILPICLASWTWVILPHELVTSASALADLASTALNPFSQTVCEGLWDNMSCWPSSALGQTVEMECPRFLQMLTSRNGSIFRNCTQGGWSETFPRADLACGVNVNDSSNEKRHEYLLKLKVMYTVGYSSSLVMLLAALSILCAFRRLHCTRNYIHMHLFVSFILRALSNFIKDAVLFSSDDVTHCDAHRVGCKLVMVFFQYCILANYAWLLVEGLYLHTLLVVSFFSERKCLQGFIALGWGSPAVFVASWAVTRHFLEDVGCWDINANASIWWVIRGPVILSILINFILFINILRILMRKLRTQETRGNEVNHYKRLAKSTLLLIPLFGIHYVVFAFSPEDAMEIQLFFELALGSFQVQLEVQKKWQQWHLREFTLRPMALNSSFSNGTSGLTHGTKTSAPEPNRSTWRASVI
ncbi:secretin receptor [Equus quagga]|uniref:secretin receptor n=1 Tax=Equus quagga TaxID=89248 RepID=UPI001EE2371B|nr:secretin receptor [Equus quagga]